MAQSGFDRVVLFLLRVLMGWTFLYAAIHHFGDNKFVVGFLGNTKTFHDVYAPLTTARVAPILTFLVEYGHLLIGLSLVFGLFVGPFRLRALHTTHQAREGIGIRRSLLFRRSFGLFVEIYRRDGSVESLTRPLTLSGEDVLPGFVLDLREIYSESQ